MKVEIGKNKNKDNGRKQNRLRGDAGFSESGAKAFGGHEFKKSLGQNFIRDTNLLRAIVQDSEISSADCVLEIGAGAGTLTGAICEKAKRVVAVEVDESLREILQERENENPNLRVVFKDIMKADMSEIHSELMLAEGQKYKVVANLPYYITTPILFRLLDDHRNISTISIMVQKEVAERIVSDETSGDYGVLTLMVKFFGEARIARMVGRQNFYPQPKVDSAIVRIDVKDGIDEELLKKYSKLVKCAFGARRKTLANNLKRGYGKTSEEIEVLLSSIGKDLNVRGEDLSYEEFVSLAKII